MSVVSEEVQKILTEQNLELVEVLQRPDTARRRFFTLQVRPSGTNVSQKDLIMKVFGRGDSPVLTSFAREVGFLRLLRDADHAVSSWTPRFLEEGGEPRPWYLRECAGGEFLGDICFDFGIKENFLTTELRREFLSFLVALHLFSETVEGTKIYNSLTKHDYRWYEDDRNFYRQHIDAVSQGELTKIGEILRAKKDLLGSEANVFVHGDLYLKNMFWSASAKLRRDGSASAKLRRDGSASAKLRRDRSASAGRGRLAVIDWELLHLGNRAFDLGFVWALSWRSPRWRECLVSEFENGLPAEELLRFRELLNIVTLSVSLRFIRHSEIMAGMVTGEALANARKAKEAHLEALHRILVL